MLFLLNKEYLNFFRNWLEHSTSTSLTPSWEVWRAKRIRMIQEKARLRLSWGTQYWHHIEHTFLEKRSECCDAALCCSGWRHCSTAEAPPSGRRNIISDYKVKSKNRQFEQKLAETLVLQFWSKIFSPDCRGLTWTLQTMTDALQSTWRQPRATWIQSGDDVDDDVDDDNLESVRFLLEVCGVKVDPSDRWVYFKLYTMFKLDKVKLKE